MFKKKKKNNHCSVTLWVDEYGTIKSDFTIGDVNEHRSILDFVGLLISVMEGSTKQSILTDLNKFLIKNDDKIHSVASNIIMSSLENRKSALEMFQNMFKQEKPNSEISDEEVPLVDPRK